MIMENISSRTAKNTLSIWLQFLDVLFPGFWINVWNARLRLLNFKLPFVLDNNDCVVTNVTAHTNQQKSDLTIKFTSISKYRYPEMGLYTVCIVLH